MEVWFRLSLLVTLLAWVAVVVGTIAVYYCGLTAWSSVIVSAGPLALVSTVATFIEWRCFRADG